MFKDNIVIKLINKYRELFISIINHHFCNVFLYENKEVNMNKDELKKIISQIKKYNLTKEFESVEKFEEWLKKLSTKQINNFNSLNVLPTEIKFPVHLLINNNLLNCDDYNKRITAMCKLKNGDGCWHLFDALCSPNFLNSKKYYQDIEMISKAPKAKYALWIINKDSFINS